MLTQIHVKARSLHPRLLLVIPLAPFWLAGAVLGSLVAAVFGVLRWAAAAVTVGWAATTTDLPKVTVEQSARWATAVLLLVVVIVLVAG